MRWYKILAGTLLMLSVTDFAFAAPVFLQERKVRVGVADAPNDGTATSPLRRDQSDKWPANAADRIPRSSDLRYWRREQVPRQHNPDSNGPSSNPAPPIDVDPQSPSVPPGFESIYPQSPSVPPGFESISPWPTSQAPNRGQGPTHSSDGTHALNPASPSDSHSWRLDLPHGHSDLDSLSSFSLQFKSLSDSDLMSVPKLETPPGDLPQIVSSPDDAHYKSTATSHVSLSPASSTVLSQDDIPYPPTSKFKSLSEILSKPTHDTPPPDGSPQIVSSPGDSYSSQSWVDTDAHSSSTSSWSSQYDISSATPPQDHVPFPSSSNLEPPSEFTSAYTPDTPPPPGPTDNRPPPASSSDPGPSLEPNPPPSAKRPRPDELESWSSLSKIFKGKFKRRFSDSGALNAAHGYLQGAL